MGFEGWWRSSFSLLIAIRNLWRISGRCCLLEKTYLFCILPNVWPLLSWGLTLHIISCGFYISSLSRLWASGRQVRTFRGPPSKSFPFLLAGCWVPRAILEATTEPPPTWVKQHFPLLLSLSQPGTSLSGFCEPETNFYCVWAIINIGNTSWKYSKGRHQLLCI